jgi:hypothetical protein
MKWRFSLSYFRDAESDGTSKEGQLHQMLPAPEIGAARGASVDDESKFSP